jgi:respiratory burst oxidase
MYKVGQYVFLNFPQVSFLEWHPFTLASGPDEEHLEVMIKGLGDYTKKLMVIAEKSGDHQLLIRVDGPY